MLENPYPGLRPFRRDEAHLFFGRDEQIDHLLDKLAQTRFITVTGLSGSGKSSLVQAGLLPNLEFGYLTDAGADWGILTMRPGITPIQNLAQAMLDAGLFSQDLAGFEDLSGLNKETTPAQVFAECLSSGGHLEFARILQECVPEGQHRSFLLVVDQFEELFRYENLSRIEERKFFVELLLIIAKQQDVPMYVVLTIRSDWLGKCALFHGLPEVINAGQFLVPRLTQEQMRLAITAPAQVAGGTIDDRLALRLLQDSELNSDQLPVVQHCLMRMWAQTQKHVYTSAVNLTLQDYEALGGLSEALSRHVNEAYAELHKRQKQIAERMFRCLTEGGLRRPAMIKDIAAVADASESEVAVVANAFRQADRCFLSPYGDAHLESETVLDISHESLIRQWRRLRKWTREETRSADVYRRLEQTAYLWKKDKAALWGTPDLENALAWKEHQRPTTVWAIRYSVTGGFDLAMDFLAKSEEKRKSDEDAKKREFQERTLTLFESYLTHATLQAKVEDYAAAQVILEQSHALDAEIPAERRHARNLLAWFANLMGAAATEVYAGAGVPLKDIAVSPDGSLLATVGEKGTAALFDAASGKLLKRLEGHTGTIRRAIFHPTGKWLVTAGDDRRIIFWMLPDGEKLQEWTAPHMIYALALSPDDNFLASGGADRNVTIWEVKTSKVLYTLKGHEKSIKRLIFSPDGRLLASAAYDRTARIWDTATGKTLHTLRGHTDDVQCVAFKPDGKLLATGSSDKTVRLWDVASGDSFKVLQGHENIVLGIVFVDVGSRLVSASRDRTLRLWDVASGVTMRVLQGHIAGVTDVIARGENLFSTGNDGVAHRWELGKNLGGSRRFALIVLPGKPISSAIAPGGSIVAVGFADGSLRFYEIKISKVSKTSEVLRLVWEKTDAHTGKITRLAFSPDGKHLVSASLDHTAKLWQVNDGSLEQIFSGHRDGVYTATFAPDGKTIATAGYDGQIGLFELGKKSGQFYPVHDGKKVKSVAFDASGARLVSAGEDGYTRLWEVDVMQPSMSWKPRQSAELVHWASFSPDGRRIVSVGRDCLVHILSVGDGSEEQTLVGHENTILRAAFSSDGGQVATVSTDVTVRLWDLTAKAELLTLRLPANIGYPTPFWDFDFRCTGRDCWIAVPLTRGQLALYYLEGIYD